jgi:hypothetical protein
MPWTIAPRPTMRLLPWRTIAGSKSAGRAKGERPLGRGLGDGGARHRGSLPLRYRPPRRHSRAQRGGKRVVFRGFIRSRGANEGASGRAIAGAIVLLTRWPRLEAFLRDHDGAGVFETKTVATSLEQPRGAGCPLSTETRDRGRCYITADDDVGPNPHPRFRGDEGHRPDSPARCSVAR